MTTPLPKLPNPFLDASTGSRPAIPGRFAARPALVVFLLCLVLGLVAVGWRAKRRANDARARAGVEALARCTALEVQFSQTLSAAEVLGALARQSGGTIPNFQKVAAELLAAWPGVASLELQPNGVVSDIVPRAGNERALGFNVLNHPAYRPGANAAIQKRGLAVAGPLPLYRGESGIVARVPVFLRGRDGRDGFWGFVAASIRLSEALRRARVDDLARQGYNYSLFAPAFANEKAVTLAARGAVSVPDAVQQPVRTQDLKFCLAVQPRGGWVSKTKLVLEFLGVLAASGLLCLLVNLLIGSLQARLDAAAHTEKKAAAALKTRLEAAQATIADLEVRLEGATRLAQDAAKASTARPVQTEDAGQESSAHSGESDEVPESSPPESGPASTPVTIPEPDAPAPPMPDVVSAEAVPPSSQPPADQKPPRATRRKKTRRDDQMDLFGTQSTADQSLAGPAANAAAEEPAVEPPAPSVTSAPEEPEKPAAEATDQAFAAPKTAPKPKDEKPARPLPAPPPLNPAELRKAVNQILPLFTGQDPGARDCLKANRATFRSAFAPEAYVEFEQSVKNGDFNAALEHLKKAAKRHGIPA